MLEGASPWSDVSDHDILEKSQKSNPVAELQRKRKSTASIPPSVSKGSSSSASSSSTLAMLADADVRDFVRKVCPSSSHGETFPPCGSSHSFCHLLIPPVESECELLKANAALPLDHHTSLVNPRPLPVVHDEKTSFECNGPADQMHQALECALAKYNPEGSPSTGSSKSFGMMIAKGVIFEVYTFAKPDCTGHIVQVQWRSGDSASFWHVYADIKNQMHLELKVNALSATPRGCNWTRGNEHELASVWHHLYPESEVLSPVKTRMSKASKPEVEDVVPSSSNGTYCGPIQGPYRLETQLTEACLASDASDNEDIRTNSNSDNMERSGLSKGPGLDSSVPVGDEANCTLDAKSVTRREQAGAVPVTNSNVGESKAKKKSKKESEASEGRTTRLRSQKSAAAKNDQQSSLDDAKPCRCYRNTWCVREYKHSGWCRRPDAASRARPKTPASFRFPTEDLSNPSDGTSLPSGPKPTVLHALNIQTPTRRKKRKRETVKNLTEEKADAKTVNSGTCNPKPNLAVKAGDEGQESHANGRRSRNLPKRGHLAKWKRHEGSECKVKVDDEWVSAKIYWVPALRTLVPQLTRFHRR